MAAWHNDPWAATGGTDGFAAGLAMGMLEAKRADVARAIQLRFSETVPHDLTASIRNIDDLDRLDRWLDAAITAGSIDVFRSMTEWGDKSARRSPSF